MDFISLKTKEGGEAANKTNADIAAQELAEFAGDFVVAVAGPDLEASLAGYGSGAAQIYQKQQITLANLDIGGGTTNVAVFQNGKRSDQTVEPGISPQSDTQNAANARSKAAVDPLTASSRTGKKFPFILVGICALGLIAVGVILFFLLHSHRKEKEDLLLRRKRRLERLEDIGYSSSDFDQLLSQKRSSAPSYKKQKHQVKRPRRKWPFSR